MFYGDRDTFINFIKYLNIYKNEIWHKAISKYTSFRNIPIGERLFNLVIEKYKINYNILDDKSIMIVSD